MRQVNIVAGVTHQNILPVFCGQVLVRRLGYTVYYVSLSRRQVQCAPRSFASIHPIIGVSGVSDRLKGFSKLTDGIIKLVLLRAKHRKCMFSNSRRYSQWSEKSGSALWLVTSYLPCLHVVTSVTKSNLASVPSSKLSFKTVVA